MRWYHLVFFALIFLIGLYLYVVSTFLDNGRSVEELKETYSTHEKDFEKLYYSFVRLLPKDGVELLSFEENEQGVAEIVIKKSGQIKRINIDKDSKELERFMFDYGWDEDKFEIIEDLLDEIDCTSISIEQINGKRVVDIGHDDRGWCYYSYQIHESDTESPIGRSIPIGNSIFSKRVFIVGDCAL